MISMDVRKELIDKEDGELSPSKQCELLSVPRSSMYYKPVPERPKDIEMMNQIDRFHTEDPTRGTRRMLECLKKEGLHVGRDRVRSLMEKMCIDVIYRRPRTTVINSAAYKYPYLLRSLKVERRNQVWALDITYVPMGKGYMYLLAIIDLHSRYIVGWSLSNTMEASWVVDVLKEAVENHGKPEIINSDQGSQFTSEVYFEYVKSLETVSISMDGKGRATDNAYIERFFRTLKYDRLYLIGVEDAHELFKECRAFIHFYNNRREHSSLKYRTPNEVFMKAA